MQKPYKIQHYLTNSKKFNSGEMDVKIKKVSRIFVAVFNRF